MFMVDILWISMVVNGDSFRVYKPTYHITGSPHLYLVIHRGLVYPPQFPDFVAI